MAAAQGKTRGWGGGRGTGELDEARVTVPTVTSDACLHQHCGPCSWCQLWENVAPGGSPPPPQGQARPGHACPRQETAGFPETGGYMCSFTQSSSAAGHPACPSPGLLAHSPSSLSAVTWLQPGVQVMGLHCVPWGAGGMILLVLVAEHRLPTPGSQLLA